jgi:hypothetical protein
VITIEGNMEIPPKLKIDLLCDPVILLGRYLKECKSTYNRDSCTLMFIAELLTIAKEWTQPRCSSTDEWIYIIYVCVHIHIYIHTIE